MNAAYSIVRFSPDPEEVESVNVALLVWSGVHRLVFDDRFAKLNCIASGVSPKLLAEQLHFIANRLERVSPDLIVEEAARLGSQFSVVGPRFLTMDLDQSLIDLLIHRYLLKPRATHSRGGESEWRTATLVERFLAEMTIPSDRLLRRATPSQFLDPKVARHLDDMHITRVISGAKDLVLLEGLDVGRFAPGYVSRVAERIAYNYFRFDRVREEIRRIEGRELRRAVLVFGEPDHEKKEFALTVASRESDFFVKDTEPSTDFLFTAKRAAASVLAPA